MKIPIGIIDTYFKPVGPLITAFYFDKLNATQGQTVLMLVPAQVRSMMISKSWSQALQPGIGSERAAYGKSIYSDVPAVNGDGYRLPFKDRSLILLLPLFLLVVERSQKVVKEMIRVTKRWLRDCSG